MGELDSAVSDQPAVNGGAGPVKGSERIESLDVLRGVAILGILVMNIYAFAMPFPAYTNPLLMGGTESLNISAWNRKRDKHEKIHRNGRT